jgi:hypothetical protein
MTIEHLRKKIENMRAEVPVVVLIVGEGEWLKAYVARAALVHDNLPDGEGGDDLQSTGTILLLEAEIAEAETEEER